MLKVKERLRPDPAEPLERHHSPGGVRPRWGKVKERLRPDPTETLERRYSPGGAMLFWGSERRPRSKRRSLNPTKIVFVYVAALCLVCFHQAGQVADWLDEVALGSGRFVSEIAFKLSADLRSSVVPRGPAQMNRAEDRLLALAPAGLMGQKPEALPQLPGFSFQVARKLDPLPPTDRIEEPARPGPIGPPTFIYQAAYRPDNPFPAAADDDLPKVFNPASVLLLGDSMMLEGLGPQLQRELKKNDGLEVYRDGRYGTGLTRLDAFDWLDYFDQILAKYDPDLIIITLGANDAQDILDPDGPKKRIRVAGAEWNAIYAGRVRELLAKAARRDVKVFWVGLPIIGRGEQLSRWFANINSITAEVCSSAANCRYWDAWLSVADEQGRYTAFTRSAEGKSVRIRAKDAIHLTEDGGRLMTRKFLAETSDWADYGQSSPLPDEPAPLENTPPTPPAAAAPTVETPSEQPAPAPSAGETDEDDQTAEPSAGVVSEHRLFSRIRGKDTVYFMAAPSGTGPFPTVFLLHGAWDGAGTWAEHLGRANLAQLAAEHELVLVMPDGEPFGWYLDGLETAIESYLIKELIPEVLRNNPAMDADRMAVTGLSMGGHGALTLALKYPRLFKAAGAMSGVTDLTAHGGLDKPNPNLHIDRVLGLPGRNGRLWHRHSAHGMTESDPKAWAGRPLIISVGRDDLLTFAENRAYHELLTRLKIAHVYREDDGGHNWDYWAGQLPAHLEFIGGRLRALKNGRGSN